MAIHPLIQSQWYSDQWKEEANRLLYRHPSSERILKLADNPRLSKRIGERGDYSNCFGTAFWIPGLTEHQLPEMLFEEEAQEILEKKGFEKLDEKDLPEDPEENILFMTEWSDGIPIHGAVYLGKTFDVPTIFEQERTGHDYRFVLTRAHTMPGFFYHKKN